jgi:hypothetical protein
MKPVLTDESGVAANERGIVFLIPGMQPRALLPDRVGRVERAEMQHSPSRSTNPEGLRMEHYLKLRERLRENVHGHVFSGAVFDVDLIVGNGLSNEVKSNVDVFGAHMVVVVGGES